MGNCRGETCAVQAGREALVNPSAVEREASASGGGDTHRKGGAPMQSRKAGEGRCSLPVPQTDTGRLAEQAKVDE
jgi:hypothetical protein